MALGVDECRSGIEDRTGTYLSWSETLFLLPEFPMLTIVIATELIGHWGARNWMASDAAQVVL
jgi:hypothetical protein